MTALGFATVVSVLRLYPALHHLVTVVPLTGEESTVTLLWRPRRPNTSLSALRETIRTIVQQSTDRG